MKHQHAMFTKLLALVLCLGLLGALGAPALGAEQSYPEEGMLSSEASVSEASGEAEASAQAKEDNSAQTGTKTQAAEEKSLAEQSAQSAPEAEPDESDEDEPDKRGAASPDEPEFWNEFHDEYAEDGDYQKWYERYQEQGVKRAFTDDDDIPGTIEALSDGEVEAMVSASNATKSPFTGKTYTHAASKAGKTVVLGIDISKWQDTIDWKKAKTAGVKFAFIRCGYTNLSKFNMHKDERFDQNIEGAYAAGVKVGIYYFSQATSESEAQKEAQKTLEILKPYKSKITMPVAMDYEQPAGSRIKKVTRATGTKIMKMFCKTIKDGGYNAYIYANSYDLTLFCDVSQVSNYGYWYAWYQANDSKSKPTAPTYTGAYDFWQYSARGKVNGISGRVDCNFWYTGKGTAETPAPTGEATSKPGQVTGLTMTENGDDYLALKWDVVSTAESYIVEGHASDTTSFTTLTTSVGNTCKVKNLTPGTTYTIRVKAKNAKGTGSASATLTVSTSGLPASQPQSADDDAENPSGDTSEEPEPTEPVQTELPAPELISAKRTDKGVKVKWKAVEGAQLYRVYRKTQTGSWTKVTETAELSAVDTNVTNATWYRYTVRCINPDGSFAGTYDPAGKTLTYFSLATPELTSVTATTTGMKLSWKAVSGAKKYRAFRKLSNGWKNLGDVTGTSLVDKTAPNGSNCVYTVRCVSKDGKSYTSSYNPDGISGYYLAASKLTAVKSTAKKVLKAQWSKNASCEGYQLRYTLSGKSSTSKVSGAKNLTATVKGLKSGKTYSVEVRCFRKVSGSTVYSAWSGAKNVKIK